MKVLLIDDNPDITDLLSKFLKAKGYENDVTNDPKDGFSGLDIIQSLETDKILKDQKIVIFSAHNFSPSEVKALLMKDGIEACLKKPIQLNELLTSMAR
jgi:DNA-binding response OmpR family regulator